MANLAVGSVPTKAGAGTKSVITTELRLRKRITLADQAWLARQLAVLSQAGLSMPASLGLLARQRSGKAVGKLAEQMRSGLLAGKTPSVVVAEHEDALGPMFVSMVAAGEHAGVLAATLARLADLLEVRLKLRKKTRAAVSYPVGVLCITVVLSLVILLVIVPIFGRMFAEFGASLPAPTRLLVSVSHLVLSHWYALPLVVAALIGAAVWGLRQDKIAYGASALALRLPVVGSLFSKTALARVSATISMMMSSGTDVLNVLAYASASTSNKVWSSMLDKVPELLRSGKGLSDSITVASAATPGTDVNFDVLAQMVEVGERSGTTSTVLEHLAKGVTEEVESNLETLESSLEPLLMIVVGAVVGAMIIALYLPIFHIITVIGNQTASSGGS